MFVVLILVAWLAVVAIIAVVQWRRAGSRVARLAQRARELGFAFEESATPFAGTDVTGLTILDQAASTQAYDVMTGKFRDCEMHVFDLRFYYPMTVSLVTFAAFRCTSPRLPVFKFGRRHVTDRLPSHRRDELPIDPQYQEAFVVHCSNGTQGRVFFNKQRVDALCRRAGPFRVESSPEWLLVYHPATKVSGKDLAQFVENASAIASALLPQKSDPMPVVA